jgi:coenzyme Q-binding protein COQ10
MSSVAEQATLGYTADELFKGVADLKYYPSFVPCCRDACVLHESGKEIIADLIIGYGPFRENFPSQVTLDRPKQVLVRATRSHCQCHVR